MSVYFSAFNKENAVAFFSEKAELAMKMAEEAAHSRPELLAASIFAASAVMLALCCCGKHNATSRPMTAVRVLSIASAATVSTTFAIAIAAFHCLHYAYCSRQRTAPPPVDPRRPPVPTPEPAAPARPTQPPVQDEQQPIHLFDQYIQASSTKPEEKILDLTRYQIADEGSFIVALRTYFASHPEVTALTMPEIENKWLLLEVLRGHRSLQLFTMLIKNHPIIVREPNGVAIVLRLEDEHPDLFKMHIA